MICPVCACRYCAAMRRMREQVREVREEGDGEETPVRSVKEGLFGARVPGSKSRFREFSSQRYALFVFDGFLGRRPGDHWTPSWPRPMPKPDFVVRAKELRIVEEVKQIASLTRVPEQTIGDAEDYRRELVAEAVVHALADVSPRKAVNRAIIKLRKLYRELA